MKSMFMKRVSQLLLFTIFMLPAAGLHASSGAEDSSSDSCGVNCHKFTASDCHTVALPSGQANLQSALSVFPSYTTAAGTQYPNQTVSLTTTGIGSVSDYTSSNNSYQKYLHKSAVVSGALNNLTNVGLSFLYRTVAFYGVNDIYLYLIPELQSRQPMPTSIAPSALNKTTTMATQGDFVQVAKDSGDQAALMGGFIEDMYNQNGKNALVLDIFSELLLLAAAKNPSGASSKGVSGWLSDINNGQSSMIESFVLGASGPDAVNLVNIIQGKQFSSVTSEIVTIVKSFDLDTIATVWKYNGDSKETGLNLDYQYFAGVLYAIANGNLYMNCSVGYDLNPQTSVVTESFDTNIYYADASSVSTKSVTLQDQVNYVTAQSILGETASSSDVQTLATALDSTPVTVPAVPAPSGVSYGSDAYNYVKATVNGQSTNVTIPSLEFLGSMAESTISYLSSTDGFYSLFSNTVVENGALGGGSGNGSLYQKACKNSSTSKVVGLKTAIVEDLGTLAGDPDSPESYVGSQQLLLKSVQALILESPIKELSSDYGDFSWVNAEYPATNILGDNGISPFFIGSISAIIQKLAGFETDFANPANIKTVGDWLGMAAVYGACWNAVACCDSSGQDYATESGIGKVWSEANNFFAYTLNMGQKGAGALMGGVAIMGGMAVLGLALKGLSGGIKKLFNKIKGNKKAKDDQKTEDESNDQVSESIDNASAEGSTTGGNDNTLGGDDNNTLGGDDGGLDTGNTGGQVTNNESNQLEGQNDQTSNLDSGVNNSESGLNSSTVQQSQQSTTNDENNTDKDSNDTGDNNDGNSGDDDGGDDGLDGGLDIG